MLFTNSMGGLLVTDTTLYQRLLDGRLNNASWSLGGDVNMANVNCISGTAKDLA